MKRLARWLLGLAAALLAIVALALVIVDTGPGHRWVAGRLSEVKTATGLRSGASTARSMAGRGSPLYASMT